MRSSPRRSHTLSPIATLPLKAWSRVFIGPRSQVIFLSAISVRCPVSTWASRLPPVTLHEVSATITSAPTTWSRISTSRVDGFALWPERHSGSWSRPSGPRPRRMTGCSSTTSIERRRAVHRFQGV